MCNHNKKYNLEKNVSNWILVAAFESIFSFVYVFEDPMVILLFGAMLGFMISWAMEIFKEWIDGKIAEIT